MSTGACRTSGILLRMVMLRMTVAVSLTVRLPGGDPALILQCVEELALPSGAETLFSEDSDMGRTTYFSCGGESWFSLDFIGCKALMRVSEDYRKAVFTVDTSAPTAGVVISSL